jgi:hypothetical protein
MRVGAADALTAWRAPRDALCTAGTRFFKLSKLRRYAADSLKAPLTMAA